MAELNFNALARPGPRGFMQGYEQGQEQRMAQETNQIAQDTSRFKLEELKRDREEAMQLQTQLKGLGHNGDLNAFFDEIAKTGKPQYVQMALEGKQKLKDLDAYAKLGGGAMPTGAPAPAVSSNRVNEPNAAPGVEVFKVNEQPAPVNALAAPAAAAMPVNALAPQPNADQIAPTQQRIKQLLDFARANPRMASQAMSEARILQDQLELFSRRGQNEPPDAVMMQRLGYPLTQAGYQAFRDAQRQERMLSPEEEKQRIRIANASRAPAPPRAEQPLEKVVDLVTGKIVFASREQALQERMTPATAMESLPPKEIQKREAAYPQATSIVKGIEDKASSFTKDLTELFNHPGLSSITGFAAGRLPGITAEGRAAQASYDKIVAKGGFQALQEMRDASKTGGALGGVSNQEGTQLKASFAAIDRRQEAKDVKKAIEQAIDDVERTKVRMREAYDSTYSYKSSAPVAPQGTGGFKYLGKEGK